jgi:muramidase (phage lysozyme)
MKTKARQSTNIYDARSLPGKAAAALRAVIPSARAHIGDPYSVSPDEIRRYEALNGPGSYRQFTENLHKIRLADNPSPDRSATRAIAEAQARDRELMRQDVEKAVRAGKMTRAQADAAIKTLGNPTPATPATRSSQAMPTRFFNSAASAFGTGYNLASPKKDKNNQTAYQRYIEKYYGPGVTSHTDPLAVARAATGAVASGLKSGAGFLGHAAAGLLGAPMGPSGGRATAAATNTGGGIGSDTGAVSGITPTNRLYGGNPGTGAGVSAYVPGTARQGMDGVLDAISQAEGTTQNGYNEVMGYGKYGGYPSKPITEMTLQEMHDFGRNVMFPAQRAKGIPENKLSSASGKFQITGDNIEAYSKKWGLDMKTTIWTPQLQERIAIDLAKNTPKGLANWEGFKYGEGKKLKQQATTALAYASTGATTTPALQAAAEQASGRATASRYERSPEIAAMQRDLNSRGAKLTVDGIRGPLTQAAEKQFLGSPTSVRTPSFTNPAYVSRANAVIPYSDSQDAGRIPAAGRVSTVNQRQDYVPTPSFANRQSYTSGRGDEGQVPRTGVASTPYLNQPYTPAATPRTPYFNNPYTSSTGGAYTSGRGDEGRGVPAPPSMNTRNMRVPTQSFVQTPYMNQPYTGPEWDVMPGLLQEPAVQVPTARIPQARPNYQPPQQAPQQAVPTLLERLDNLVERAERALGGNRGSDSRSSGGRSSGGGAGSPNSGLGYSGGRGYGGGSIGRGTGGAINPNR